MARRTAKTSHKGSNAVLVFGFILMIIGVGLMMSSGIQLPPLSWVGVETPAGSVAIGDISEEQASRIGVGAIVSVFGLSLIIAGLVKR
ncbi:MAG: hypothetical protein ACRENZ_07525 [Thermodesulfobacteriota bacterium]